MSARLLGEVCAWLGTPAAQGLTPSERLILVVIAERANEHTRQMWRHRGDEMTLTELISMRAGIGLDGVTKALRRLASRGLEVRRPIGHTASGRPVFARRTYATDYVLPALPASVQLPPPRWKPGLEGGQSP